MFAAQRERTDFFNEQAAEWDHTEKYEQDRDRLYRLITSLPIGEGDRVLDAGTGTGIALGPLRSVVGSEGIVIGVDLATAMLRKAKQGHHAVVHADCHHLPFRSGWFDCVFAFAVIPHLDILPAFFRETASLLRPGGELIILHLMSRRSINDFHRKAGSAVETDFLPSAEGLAGLGQAVGISRTLFTEEDDLFLWIGERSE